MEVEPTQYHRRAFLSQCAAIPLAASFVSIDAAHTRGDQSDDLQALLKYVPPTARYQRQPVPEADNAWPVLLKAKEVIQIPDELFEDDGNETVLGRSHDASLVPAEARAADSFMIFSLNTTTCCA